ncbi:MAG: GNAT family N-acetyltransferase, partial [Streptosporangiaceae bacterium]
MIRFRPMTEGDLPAIAAWLALPHVARWWTAGTTAGAELAEYRDRVSGGIDPATVMLMVLRDDVPVGWCQWYRWADYPAEAAEMGARDGEAGIDYAIGDPQCIGRGMGTELIAALVAEVRRHHPGAGIMADPDAANTASRRVLEKNGFELVAVRPVSTEPNDAPMAIYRLPGHGSDTCAPTTWPGDISHGTADGAAGFLAARLPIIARMPPKPRSAEYFDGWYASQAAMPTVAEIMNRHMGFPPDTRAGVVIAEAIPELAAELRLAPGSTLLDLACGRGAYGLLIAQATGASLIGADFS